MQLVVQARPRDVVAYSTGRFLTVVGDTILQISVPFYILGSGGGLTVVGLVQVARWLPVLLVALWGGVLGDRFDRRRIVLVTDMVGLAAALLIGACATFLEPGPSYVGVTVGMALVGAASSVRSPSLAGLLKSVAGTGDTQRTVAQSNLAEGAAGALGPAIGGMLIGIVPLGGAAVLNAATYAAGCALVLAATRGHTNGTEPGVARRSMVHDLREGFRTVGRMPWLVVGIAGSALYQLLFVPTLFVLGPGYAYEHLQDGARAWGLAMGAMGVGAVLGGLVAGRWRPRRTASSSFAVLALTPVATLSLALGAPTGAVLGCFLVMGAATTVASSLWTTAVFHAVDESRVSRVTSVNVFGALLFKPIGQAGVGPLAGGIGAATATTVLGCAAMVIQVATSVALRMWEKRRPV